LTGAAQAAASAESPDAAEAATADGVETVSTFDVFSDVRLIAAIDGSGVAIALCDCAKAISPKSPASRAVNERQLETDSKV
jgi:hypothetical protein